MKEPDTSNHNNQKGSSGVSRRGFLTSCTACAACLALRPDTFLKSSVKLKEQEKTARIRIFYSLHGPVQTQPDWPNVGFDFNPVMAKINNALECSFPEYEFLPSLASGEEDAVKIIQQDEKENILGYIVYQMNCWNRVVQTAAKTGKPVLYADLQYAGSGGFLVYTATFLDNKTPNVGFVASSKMGDFIAAVSCFNIVRNGGPVSDFVNATERVRIGSTPAARKYAVHANDIKFLSPGECTKQLAASRILAVKDQSASVAAPLMGIPLEYIPLEEVNDAWRRADTAKSAEIADGWQRSALEVAGVDHETLLTSAAMYLGMKEVMQKHKAKAITINCLGGFYGGHIHAYPCLGFHEL